MKNHWLRQKDFKDKVKFSVPFVLSSNEEILVDACVHKDDVEWATKKDSPVAPSRYPRANSALNPSGLWMGALQA